ncbi:FMN-binding protein [Aeromicrobium massiliense]|uniref:FMN-binding protein n=1 Tax=Aeromicrobium massiliense TaxID=1464554 RepID=UPI0002EB5037|nr:FMN-binding protein [Aeromicrobium massiliense]
MKLTRLPQAAAGAAAASLMLLTAACGSDDSSDASSEATSASPSPEASQEAPADAAPDAGATGTYTAGDYDAEGSYQTPAGTQSVEVEVTLEADGTITAVEVDPQAEGGNSEMFQKKFAGGISKVVVGKKIDELDVSKVAGSSLTSGGFNAAIEDIAGQAQA